MPTGLHPTNLGWLVLGRPAPLPCTPFGIVELLRRHGVEIKGADGRRGRSRGHRSARPLGLLLTRPARTPPSPCATPAPVTWRRHDAAPPTSSSPRPACPAIISADMVKPGAAVLDVGGLARRRQAGRRRRAATVPRRRRLGLARTRAGCGPMTRAMLLVQHRQAPPQEQPRSAAADGRARSPATRRSAGWSTSPRARAAGRRAGDRVLGRVARRGSRVDRPPGCCVGRPRAARRSPTRRRRCCGCAASWSDVLMLAGCGSWL